MTQQVRLMYGDVCGTYNSSDAYWCKELWNISTEETGDKLSHYIDNTLNVCVCVLLRQQPLCACLYRGVCVCVAIFHVLKKKKAFLRFPHSQIACVFLKSKRESGGLTCQQFTITVLSAQRFNRSSPPMIHKWITVFKHKEITGTSLFREKRKYVYMSVKKLFFFLFCFLCEGLHGRT